MPEIIPEPTRPADPSHPQWAPPDGNEVDVGHDDAPVAADEDG